MHDANHCDVLVAAADRDFLHVAAAIVARAGYVVHTTTDRPERVVRLVVLRTPGVLVLDVGAPVGEFLRKRVAVLELPVAVVLVADDPRICDWSEIPVLAKWGPPDQLVDAVQRVLGHSSRVS
jgi:hypothetical protein